MNNRIRRVLRGISGNGDGGQPQPQLRRVSINRVEAATILQISQEITQLQQRLNALVVGMLASRDVEASQNVRLVGAEVGKPVLEFTDLTAVNRWRATHPQPEPQPGSQPTPNETPA